MKISKIFAGMSALAIAAATAIPAFAEKTFVDQTGLDYVTVDGSNYKVNLAASPYETTTVSSVKLTFTVEDESAGFGGAFVLNSKGSGWDQRQPDWEWGNPDADKTIVAEGSDGNYTVTFNFDPQAQEYWGDPSAEGYYAEVCCCSWWGADITVTGVEITGDLKPEDASSAAEDASSAAEDASSAADSASSAADSASSAADSSKAATTNNNGKSGTTTTTATSSAAAASDNTNQATGTTAGIALAGLALAGAVAVVAKRK
jgi:hypothetical protein